MGSPLAEVREAYAAVLERGRDRPLPQACQIGDHAQLDLRRGVSCEQVVDLDPLERPDGLARDPVTADVVGREVLLG